MKASLAAALGLVLLLAAFGAAAQTYPWDDRALGPDRRAALVLAEMTLDEKLQLVLGHFGSAMEFRGQPYQPPPEAIMGSAGYVPGVPRLGIPPLYETDAGLGVATQASSRDRLRERTSLPSGLATAASWNEELAYAGGKMIGAEARASGFNVMLAGGVNLMREPRNGRNFEYGGEDPLLAGRIVGAEIAGLQSNHIVSTIKHFALNDQESGRTFLDARLADDQARLSDLLAFQIAIERGDPGAVMCAYNRVNGAFACENEALLDGILKREWGFKGFVMSDWGAVHSTAKAANAGLDQESGAQFDDQPYFGEALRRAVEEGQVPLSRLDGMVRRILIALFAKGVIDHPVAVAPIDFAAHARISRSDAEEGIVLLRNEAGLLPLSSSIRRLAVIGGHADVGVLAGGGSSLVYPAGGNAVPGLAPSSWPGPVMFHPSSPLQAIGKRLKAAEIRFDDGRDPAAAARLAAESDVALVFVTQWMAEDRDVDSLDLPDGQDGLVAAVVAANKRTVVVVESGGPVLMPWLGQVGAVLEAWYPGSSGGEAIARLLFGEIDASGRLPASFPQSPAQLPRPVLDRPAAAGQSFPVTYQEGAAVGYKWFDAQGLTPLFPFGYGLSYSRFRHDRLAARWRDGKLTVSFTVTNIGARSGKDVPQIYVGPRQGGWEAPRRLAGWRKIALRKGESRRVSITIDPRLLALFDGAGKAWRIAAGDYDIWLGSSSREFQAKTSLRLDPRNLPTALTLP